MQLLLGSRAYDLTTHALVMGTVERAGAVAEAVREGADIVEVRHVDGPLTAEVPICVASVPVAGAALVRLGGASPEYRRCVDAGAAIVVAPGDAGAAERAGIPHCRIVVAGGDPRGGYPVLVDVTGAASAIAATAVAVVRGARIVRTPDVRGARRICDVLAAVMGAGR